MHSDLCVADTRYCFRNAFRQISAIGSFLSYHFVPWQALSMHLLYQNENAWMRSHAVGLLTIPGDIRFESLQSDTRASRIDKTSVARMTGWTQLSHASDTSFRHSICQVPSAPSMPFSDPAHRSLAVSSPTLPSLSL